MKSFGKKHPLADDSAHVLLSGEKVRVMGRSENQYSGLLYWIVSVKDGNQSMCSKAAFRNPEDLKF